MSRVEEALDEKRRYVFRCAVCRATERVEWEAVDGKPLPPPPTCCARWMTYVGKIRGRVNEQHRCDARCEYATGLNCDCACGGKNHGIGHLRSARVA